MLVGVSTVVALATVGSAAPAQAVVGGTPIDPATRPYFVLLTTSTGRCGGSAIAVGWVLTAAHCVENDVDDPHFVQVVRPMADGGVPWPDYWAATEIIVHPLWDTFHPRHGHDVALVHLPGNALAAVPAIQVGAAWTPSLYAPGQPVTMMGYGRTAIDEPGSSTLLTADTVVRSDSDMEGILGDGLPDSLLIGAGAPGRTVCVNDSGGPLVRDPDGPNPIQLGVVSFGTDDCSNAAAFAELAGPQLAWIASIVPSVADRWGQCTSEFGTPGDNHATYGTVATPGSQPDGPNFWRIWCWVPTVAVPNVRGLTRPGATAVLQGAGLQLGTIGSVVDPTCNNIGLVMSQTPAPNAQVPLGWSVSVRLGSRPKTPCP
jgi:hypothetical protein